MFILAIFMVVPLVFAGCGTTKDYIFSLKYVENFKIMQLADVQASSVEKCEEAFVDIKKMVEKEKPNLIVLSGDNIDVPENEDVFNCLVENMESLNTPWAPVFGNHDAEGVLTKEFMAERFKQAKNCYFASGEEGVDGVGNYVINIMDKKEVVCSVFLIDGNMYYDEEKTEYDSIHPNQIEWYEETVNFIKESNHNKTPKSLAFFHIPLHEYRDAKESFERGESEGRAEFNEGIYSGYENTGFFEKVKELQSTKAIFCGHDHANTCDINYQGVHLVYGLKSSRDSYYNESLLGTTIVTLSKTEIKIENKFFRDLD